MAQLNNLVVTGSFLLGNTENTSSAGNMWYDTNANRVKYSYFGASWSTGGTMIESNIYNKAGAGTQNAALSFGGFSFSSFSPMSCTEEYNGSSWSAGGSLITARCGLAGAGEQNAGLAFGGNAGSSVSCTEEYNGTSWSAGGALITARFQLAGAGTQNAGLAFGGASGVLSCTEEYNGTSWTAGGALITARRYLGSAGTQNAGLAFGGDGGYNCTEEYNGTSWSSGGALSTARYNLAGAGTQNAGLAFGGRPQYVYGGSNAALKCTEEYNGSSWSAGGALINARGDLEGAGTQTAGLAFGGTNGTYGICTEEYNATIVICTL